MFSPDYVALLVLHTIAVVWIIYKIAIEEKASPKKSDDSDNEGGVPEDFDFPDLDLPPGVSLPSDKIKDQEDIAA